jgi:hypothetical protein
MLAGALIRHSFVARHKAHVLGKRAPWEFAVAGTLVLLGLAFWLAPKPPTPSRRPGPGPRRPSRPTTPRCARSSTSAAPCATTRRCSRRTWPCTTPQSLGRHAQNVYQQSVVLKAMPMNNATQITDAERDRDQALVRGRCPAEVSAGRRAGPGLAAPLRAGRPGHEAPDLVDHRLGLVHPDGVAAVLEDAQPRAWHEAGDLLAELGRADPVVAAGQHEGGGGDARPARGAGRSSAGSRRAQRPG